jgi:DNA-binding MarR family transcriptional regulator
VKQALTTKRREANDSATTRSTLPSGAELRAWLRLLGCSNLILTRLRRALRAQSGMTLPTFDILVQINRPPEWPTLGELSERLMVSKGSVTDLMERLERQDLVIRRADPHDGRVQRVALTAKGKRLLDRVVPVHDACIRAAFAGMDPETIEDMHRALGRLKQALREPEPARRAALERMPDCGPMGRRHRL